jgi:hypothetical protein
MEIERVIPSIPYENTLPLYVMHFFFAFTARMWDMGIVLLLSDLSNNNLTLVAFAGLLTCLYIVLFMPSIGSFLDHHNRLVAAQYSCFIKLFSVTTAYGLCVYLSFQQDYLERNFSSISMKAFTYILYFVPFISALGNLSFSAVSQSVEKDWIVVLSSGDGVWLTRTNSRMTQIDSACNAFAPALTGLLFSSFQQSTSALILLVTNCFSTFLLYFFLYNLYHSWTSLAYRSLVPSKVLKSEPISEKQSDETTSLMHSIKIPDSSLNLQEQSQVSEGFFHAFFHCGCAGTLMSYAFLYLTVLNFGSMMVVYLRYCQVSDGWIGFARGAGAVTGLLGATVFPYFIHLVGIYQASNISLFFQFICVLTACLSFFFISHETSSGHTGVAVLVVAVVSLSFSLCILSFLSTL